MTVVKRHCARRISASPLSQMCHSQPSLCHYDHDRGARWPRGSSTMRMPPVTERFFQLGSAAALVFDCAQNLRDYAKTFFSRSVVLAAGLVLMAASSVPR